MNGLALCAGIGGIELGLSLVVPGYRTVCWVENEPYCVDVLRARMRDGCLDDAPVWDDVRTFDGRPWRGAVDIVTAGYPCQPFSQANQHRRDSDSRHLWPALARVVGDAQPAVVCCENVAVHLSRGFQDVAGDMEALGYRVAAGIFSAGALGACHRRERLFWLAAHPDRLALRDEPERGEGFAQEAKPRDTELVDAGEAGGAAWPPSWLASPRVARAGDGLPARMVRDRERALGNSVVPAVAARAFVTLLGELKGANKAGKPEE